mgnify:CR=1 FL=1
MTAPFVLVVWDDAWQDQENFVTQHGIIQTHHPITVQTLGWLLVDDETGVSVANERSSESGQDTYRGRTFVPRAMVRSVAPFTISKPRKSRKAKYSKLHPVDVAILGGDPSL